ncbi:MAG: EamA family transporter [Bacteroidales bacterium]|nr:EamA family transporter [Bacteroidales bacterium]
MLLPLAIIQALLLAAGQVLLKFALRAAGAFEWSAGFFASQLTNWWWLACGISFGGAGILWMYILRNYPFSQAYPLSSLAYVFGMVAALWLFDEHISLTAWIGVLLIMAGCYLVTR